MRSIATGRFFYFVLALLVGFFILVSTIVASRFGRVLRGVRDNPTRMRATGSRRSPISWPPMSSAA